MFRSYLLISALLISSFMSWGQNKVIPFIDTLSRHLYRAEYARTQELAYERLSVKNLSDNERAHIYLMLSDVERLTTHPKLGIEKAFKAVRILNNSKETAAQRSIPYAYHKIANIYFERRFMDSSLAYAIKSNEIARSIPITNEGIDRVKMLNLPILTQYYLREKKFTLARESIIEAEKLLKQYDSPCELALNQLKYSNLEKDQGNYTKAFAHAKRALAIADSCKIYTYQMLAINELKFIALQLKDAQAVYDFSNHKDEVYKAYRVEQQQNDIRSLELKHNQEKERRKNQELERENELRRNLNFLYISIIVLACSALIILFYMSRKLKRNMATLDAQRLETERINQLNRRIFSVLSHDFKAPLSNLQMGLDLLHTNGLSADDFKSLSDTVRKQMTQSQLMMENLLNWAQSELSGASQQQYTTYPYQTAVAIVHELEALTATKELKVINQIPQDVAVNVNPETLKIVYRNLVNNAIKYSYNKGKITLGYTAENQTFYVSDEGIGLDEKLLKQLFNSPSQNSSSTRPDTGYSLGLHMIEELIAQLGGQIWAETNIPKGLIAKMKLPMSNLD